MTTQASRRIAVLESLPTPVRTQTAEEIHAGNIATAARCGFTEEQVMARFGGWPAFIYACFTGEVCDPAVPKFDVEKWLDGRDPMTAYMEMLGVGRGRSKAW